MKWSRLLHGNAAGLVLVGLPWTFLPAPPAIGQVPIPRRVVQIEMPESSGSGATGLAIDADGRIWVTLRGRGSLAMVDGSSCAGPRPDCTVAEFPLTDPDARPILIAVGPDGNVWLTAVRSDANGLVYRFDPSTEEFTEYEAPDREGYSSSPHDIVVDSRGIAWFTDLFLGTLTSINPTGGHVHTEYRTDGDAGTWPPTRGVAVGANDVIWCACGTDLVRYHRTFEDPVVATLGIHPIPDAGRPRGVIVDGALVWVLDQNGVLYRFTPSAGTFDSWVVPPLPGVEGTVDPHWLVKGGNAIAYTGFVGVVGTFNVRSETFGPYVVSPSRDEPGGSGAFDIAMDPAGRVWFTEASANALSRLVFRLPPPRQIRIPGPGPPLPDL